MTHLLQARLLSLAFFISIVSNAQNSVYEPWYWVAASYGTPVLTNTAYNQNGIIELKVGGRLTASNISLVGGVNNSLNSATNPTPERFSLFLGPGYYFTDRWIFFDLHTGLSYPFYRNKPPEQEQSLGIHSALDLGIRIVPKFTVGVGLNNYITNDVPAYTFRFFIMLSGE